MRAVCREERGGRGLGGREVGRETWEQNWEGIRGARENKRDQERRNPERDLEGKKSQYKKRS